MTNFGLSMLAIVAGDFQPMRLRVLGVSKVLGSLAGLRFLDVCTINQDIETELS